MRTMTSLFAAAMLLCPALTRAEDAAAPAAQLPTAHLPTTQPTKFTLHIDAQQSNDASRQLSDELGVRVMMNGMMRRAIKYDAPEQPFVVGLTAFFKAAGLSPGNNGDNMLFLMDAAPLRIVPINDELSLLVSRTQVSATAWVHPQQQTNYQYNVQMALLTDPALKILSVAQNMTIDTLDYDGTPRRRENNYYGDSRPMGLSPAPSWPINISISSMQPAKLIKHLGGRARCWQVAEEATVDIDVADIGTSKVIAGSGVSASAVPSTSGRENEMSIIVTGPAAALYADPQWQNALRGVVQAVDTAGKNLPLSTNNVEIDVHEKSLTFHVFGGQGQAEDDFVEKLATLKVRLPTKIRMVEIPIELNDLPLP